MLNRLLFEADRLQLLVADSILELCRLGLVLQVLSDGTVNPVFVVNVQLIMEGIPPVIVSSQLLETLFEIVGQEALGDVHALQLLKGSPLLPSFVPGILPVLILDLDSHHFFFDFVLPLRIFKFSPFVVLKFELADLVKFVLLFNLEDRLFDRFV